MVAIWCGQPFWSLPLPLPLPLWPPLSLPLFLPFFPPLGKVSLPFCWATVKILSQSGVIPCGAFGWAFARAHRDLRRRFTFRRSGLKAGVYCARRGRRDGRSRCRRGWLSQWGARMHANRTWTVWRRSIRLRPVSEIRGEGGGVWPRGAGTSGALVVVLARVRKPG